MTPILEQVIEALREELQQYGEMLALLETQQGSLSGGDFDSFSHANRALDSQRGVLATSRTHRENLQRQLAWTLGQPESETFQNLFPLIPENYRPLLRALVREINELIEHVRVRLQFNHTLLRRSLESTEAMLHTISSQANSALLVEERNSSGAESSPCTVSAAIV